MNMMHGYGKGAGMVLALMVLVLVLAALPSRAQDSGATGVSAKSFERRITLSVGADYLLFLPKDYTANSDKRWPLILFLHGAGERGSDVQKVKIHGPIKVAEAKGDFPFIVAAPQCPEGVWWDSKLDTLFALLDELADNYRIDEDRVYLTGLSMGGFGTWALAMAEPQRFAAIAPICGGGNAFTVGAIKNLPVWVFHGGKDTTVPLKRSEEMVAALKNAGAPEVKFTVYPEAGHDSWTETYNNQALYDWFLAHKRKPAEPAKAPEASE